MDQILKLQALDTNAAVPSEGGSWISLCCGSCYSVGCGPIIIER